MNLGCINAVRLLWSSARMVRSSNAQRLHPSSSASPQKKLPKNPRWSSHLPYLLVVIRNANRILTLWCSKIKYSLQNSKKQRTPAGIPSPNGNLNNFCLQFNSHNRCIYFLANSSTELSCNHKHSNGWRSLFLSNHKRPLIPVHRVTWDFAPLGE